MKLEIPISEKRLSYEMKSQVIKNLSEEFFTTDDLFKLAEVYILSYEILKSNSFPFKAYKRWRKNI